MRTGADSGHLDLLTRLGHRLPRIRSAEAAAVEVTRALTALDVVACVSAVEADIAVIVTMNLPPSASTQHSSELAAALIGTRVPLDGVESLRQPVRLRRPYYGVAGAVDTLRRVADSAVVHALPNAADESIVLSVPVVARDSVVAVLSVWGPGCSPNLAPTLEVVAAMLAASWETEQGPALRRFHAPAHPLPDDELRRTIDSLLTDGTIVAAVQPIVRLYDDTVIGYEALARYPPHADVATPDDLFASAASLNMQASVDVACLRAALRAAANLGEADLFVNVLIGTLLDQSGMAALDNAADVAKVDPSSIVLEFSEREPVPDLAALQRIAAELRARGYRIAVDDAGAGHASMRVIAELRPEFIKVDRSLIHAIDSDRARRALVVALLSFGGHIGARIVAEGIETDPEQEALLSLGVQFGQGWRLGRPVLTRSLEGHEDVEVVDPTWFARRRVSPIRDPVPSSVAPTPAPIQTPTRGNRARRGLARALTDAARALQSEHDPLRILGVMAEQMRRVVPVTEMAIFVADYETHRLVPVLATGPDSDEILADSFSLDAGMTGWAFGKGTPQNIADTTLHPLARQVPGTSVVEESLLLIPLVAGEHKLGIINCWRLGVGRFTDRELEAASLFAHVAASAWRNAQLYVELVNAAMTDPLTRLYNSRWLRDAGERDLIRAARDGKPLALLLVDLDRFKTVNDTAGHAVGDLLLQRVATRLRMTVRGADAVVRLGGEEFVVLLHDCDVDGAARVAEAVRIAVRDVALPDGCGLKRLTASIGVAVYPLHGRDLDQLLGAADRAMYAAKHGGRDRLVSAVPLPDSATVIPLARRRGRSASGVRPGEADERVRRPATS